MSTSVNRSARASSSPPRACSGADDAERAHDDAVPGVHEPRGRIPAYVERRLLCELGQAEVQHFHEAVGTDHHVFRLEVAVNDPGLVRGGERLGDLQRDVECTVEVEAAPFKQ